MPARIWFAMDAMFTRDHAIEKLGMEFGPAGPLAIAHLLGVAKLHDQGGSFEIHWRALAHAVYVDDVSVVAAIVTEASRIGFLEVTRRDEKMFVGNFPGWAQWQPEKVLARERQRRHRAKARTDAVAPVASHAVVTDAVTPVSRSERDKSVTTGTDTDTGTEGTTTATAPPLNLASTVQEVLNVLDSHPSWTVDDVRTRGQVENALAVEGDPAIAVKAAHDAVAWKFGDCKMDDPGAAFRVVLRQHRKGSAPASREHPADRMIRELDEMTFGEAA